MRSANIVAGGVSFCLNVDCVQTKRIYAQDPIDPAIGAFFCRLGTAEPTSAVSHAVEQIRNYALKSYRRDRTENL